MRKYLTTARAAPQRNRKHSLRVIINAIFFVNNTGTQWRNLDSKYPPWETVFYYGAAFRFTHLKTRGVLGKILDSLVVTERIKNGKECSPSLLAIDSQSVKIVQFISQEKGIDGGKNVNGQKRTILVDTLGLPFSIKVTAANISDNQSNRRCGGYFSSRFIKRKSNKITKNNRRHGL